MRERGFTLIELLVVLVILGCLVGLAVIGSGLAGPARELRGEAERLAGLIGVLADEAVMDNREYGLSFSHEGYRVLRYDSQRSTWQTVDQRVHRLPEWVELRFEVEGDVARLPGKQNEQIPQLLILSSGEMTPFNLRLMERREGGLRLQLTSDGFRLPRVEELTRERSG